MTRPAPMSRVDRFHSGARDPLPPLRQGLRPHRQRHRDFAHRRTRSNPGEADPCLAPEVRAGTLTVITLPFPPRTSNLRGGPAWAAGWAIRRQRLIDDFGQEQERGLGRKAGLAETAVRNYCGTGEQLANLNIHVPSPAAAPP